MSLLAAGECNVVLNAYYRAFESLEALRGPNCKQCFQIKQSQRERKTDFNQTNCLYTGLPATRLSCLDRVLRSAARLIGRIPKYDHISIYMRDILHWLPARQRIEYRMAALVWRCLLGLAPAYLVGFCGPIQSARSSRSLRSADQGLLRVPFARTSARQKRAFAVVGPSIWNGLPLSIRSLPRTLSQTFLSQLKAVLFGRVGVGSASE